MSVDIQRAELEVLEQEEAFVAAKLSGEVTDGQKVALREARRRFRELRDGTGRPATGSARPAGVKGKSAVTGEGA